MSARATIAALLAAAVACQGAAEGELEDGVGVLVRARGERRQIVFRHAERPLGVVELIGLRVAGDIPDAAARADYPHQPGRSGWRVAFTWEVAPAQPNLFDQPGTTSEVPRLPEPYRLPEIADLPDHL